MRALSAAQAAALDIALMSVGGYELSTLVELAGQAVASAVSALYPLEGDARRYRNVVVISGPGNNGADGLAAARHLAAAGYSVRVALPAPPSAARAGSDSSVVHSRVLAQLKSWNVPVFSSVASALAQPAEQETHVLVDALFGFSYSGSAPRPPLDTALRELVEAAGSIACVSVDVPSGWPVDAPDSWRPVAGVSLFPSALVSLSAPKSCANAFSGPHFLGLHAAIPPHMAAEFDIARPGKRQGDLELVERLS